MKLLKNEVAGDVKLLENEGAESECVKLLET